MLASTDIYLHVLEGYRGEEREGERGEPLSLCQLEGEGSQKNKTSTISLFRIHEVHEELSSRIHGSLTGELKPA